MRKIYDQPVRFGIVIPKVSFALLAKLSQRTGKKKNALIVGMIEEALKKEFPEGDTHNQGVLPPPKGR